MAHQPTLKHTQAVMTNGINSITNCRSYLVDNVLLLIQPPIHTDLLVKVQCHHLEHLQVLFHC